MFDGAASADARMHGVSAGAKPVFLRLQIKSAVEIQRRAILIELGANPGAAGENEVDLALT